MLRLLRIDNIETLLEYYWQPALCYKACRYNNNIVLQNSAGRMACAYFIPIRVYSIIN